MVQLKKILLATDFSETSQKALEYATTLAEKLNAELDVVTIIDPSIVDFGTTHFTVGGVSAWAEKYKKLGEDVQKKLKDIEETFKISGKTHLLEGNPGKKLVAFTKENAYDLLIMGSHGYGRLDRFVLGSVSEYTMRNAHCPVFIVKK